MLDIPLRAFALFRPDRITTALVPPPGANAWPVKNGRPGVGQVPILAVPLS